jgi:hypothetical protein
MTDFDPTAIGALGLLIPAVVLLIVVLYIVPFRSGSRRGRPAPTSG